MLTPDMNLKALTLYHSSNKVLLPLSALSYINYKYKLKYDSYIYPVTSSLIGYHSYLSTSCIITDYLKPPTLNSFARMVNAKSHFLATTGFLYYIYQQNKEM
jgi:hypothetical protein